MYIFFFFSSRRRNTSFDCDWSSDVCSSDLPQWFPALRWAAAAAVVLALGFALGRQSSNAKAELAALKNSVAKDRKSTRLNSSHSQISYAVFCLKKKKKTILDNGVIIARHAL